MYPSLTPVAGLPVADMQQIDAACDRFEAAWRAGERPRMPTIVFHGDADQTVHPRNGEHLVAAVLAGHDGAPRAGEARTQSFNGRSVTQRTYADARGRAAVEHWLLHDGGHAWAGGSPEGSFTDPAGPDASAEMLRFFLDHPRGDHLSGAA